MNINEFRNIIEVISNRFDGNVEMTETNIKLTIANATYSNDLTMISDIISRMESMTKSKVAIYDDKNYEIALDRRLDIVRFFDIREFEPIEDFENKIDYKIENASPEYTLWFLSCFEVKDLRRLKDLNFSRASTRYMLESQVSATSSLFDFLSQTLRSLLTLKIHSVISKTEKQMEQLFDSFRFQIANTYNDVIMPIDDFKDMSTRMVGRRPVNSNNICAAPKRIYNNELTGQYYMGLSSKLPFVEFISYYHVIEYFFEKVYNDDMIKNLQDRISSPRFSVKREQDIKEIVKYVNKKVHDKNENYDINELEALELVLKKYIDLSELLHTISAQQIEYYRTMEVPFSNGDIVDFNDITNPKIYRKFAARIYKTRNSIVHSKSGDKAVYSPFQDDKSLEMEIPLIRYIAEEIIIKTSTIMRF